MKRDFPRGRALCNSERWEVPRTHVSASANARLASLKWRALGLCTASAPNGGGWSWRRGHATLCTLVYVRPSITLRTINTRSRPISTLAPSSCSHVSASHAAQTCWYWFRSQADESLPSQPLVNAPLLRGRLVMISYPASLTYQVL
jgi:hypothetical protein